MRRFYAQLRSHAAPVGRKLIRTFTTLGTRLATKVPGQGLVEYGLLLVLIMVVCVGILTVVGQTVSGVWYDKIIQAFT